MSTKIIVLTGATRGLGRALTAGFIAEGHTVVGCGRNANDIETLRHTYGAPHDFSVVDVADPTAVSAWAERILKQFGPPDLLINNAALMNRLAPLWEIEPDEFTQLMQVNVMGVAHVIRYFVPAMVTRRQGVIVNLSSGWGRSTSPQVAPYCASKFAIEGLSQAMAQELPPGMACIPLNPGIIDTDMLRQAWGSAAHAYPSPERWAKAAVPMLLRLGPENNGKSLTIRG